MYMEESIPEIRTYNQNHLESWCDGVFWGGRIGSHLYSRPISTTTFQPSRARQARDGTSLARKVLSDTGPLSSWSPSYEWGFDVGSLASCIGVESPTRSIMFPPRGQPKRIISAPAAVTLSWLPLRHDMKEWSGQTAKGRLLRGPA